MPWPVAVGGQLPAADSGRGTVIHADNFVQGSQAFLETRTPDTGTSWINEIGGSSRWQVAGSSGGYIFSTGGNGDAAHGIAPEPTGGNLTIEARIYNPSGLGTDIRIYPRMNAGTLFQNCFMLQWTESNFRIYRFDNGSLQGPLLNRSDLGLDGANYFHIGATFDVTADTIDAYSPDDRLDILATLTNVTQHESNTRLLLGRWAAPPGEVFEWRVQDPDVSAGITHNLAGISSNATLGSTRADHIHALGGILSTSTLGTVTVEEGAAPIVHPLAGLQGTPTLGTPTVELGPGPIVHVLSGLADAATLGTVTPGVSEEIVPLAGIQAAAQLGVASGRFGGWIEQPIAGSNWVEQPRA